MAQHHSLEAACDPSLEAEAGWPPAPVRLAAGEEAGATQRLFHHHLYELGRGVRPLFLMTLGTRDLPPLLARLERAGIDHFVQQVSPAKANLFFGRDAFVAVARALVTRPLNALTAEEDFMLGTMLGYDREQQCRRYLTRSGRGLDRPALAAE